MMKFFFRALFLVILIAILGISLVAYFGWSHIPDYLSTKLSTILKVPVGISDLSVKWNEIHIKHLEIGNPPNYKLQKALSFDEMSIKAKPLTYLQHHVIIDELEINNIYIGLEFSSPKDLQSNWSTLIKQAKEVQDKKSNSKLKHILIKRLVLTNIFSDLNYQQGQTDIKHLPTIKQIVLKNINSQGKDLINQLILSTLGQAIKEIIQANLKDTMIQLVNPSEGSPTIDAFQQLKELLNSSGKKKP